MELVIIFYVKLETYIIITIISLLANSLMICFVDWLCNVTTNGGGAHVTDYEKFMIALLATAINMLLKFRIKKEG